MLDLAKEETLPKKKKHCAVKVIDLARDEKSTEIRLSCRSA